MPIAVVDLDGVLADVRHRVHHVERRPKDWDAFFAAAPQDPVLLEGRAVVDLLAAEGDVVYLTGRPERCRVDTEEWLRRHDLPVGPVYMRADRDHRPARYTKLSTLQRLGGPSEVSVVVDDDAAVVRTLREAGYQVMHADWMGGGTEGVDGLPAPSVVQATLFEAQETEGRT
ncbi:MAG: hypothetical protein R2737_10835 [Candidatus Nanopelagicales bacterium]